MERIIILEDDPNILNNLTELLEGEGYTVYVGTDGTDGVALLKKVKPDLIICDIMMPKMNGHEFFKYVKGFHEYRFIPFVFLTAKTDLISIREGLTLGADDYVTKPFAIKDLLKTVEVRLKKQKDFNTQIESLVKNIDMYIPHELRTPLVSIIGYSQLVLADLDSMEKYDIKEMTEKILWSARRLHARIEKFISYSEFNLYNSRLSDSEIRNTTEINADYFSEIISNHYLVAERESDIRLEIKPAVLMISDNHLKIIFKEIIENAAKYSAINSEIHINGKVTGNEYALSIKDTGIGMNKENMDNIGVFQQFSREEYSQQGNGIGLAIVKKIVQLYNIKMEIESVKNQFTKVILKLPVKQ